MVRASPYMGVFRFTRIISLVAAVLALLCAWWSLERGIVFSRVALNYEPPLDGQEGMALWEASLLRDGQGLYQPVVPERFVSAPYPPIHPLVLALLGPPESPNVFREGRVVSLVAALGVALCGFGAVYGLTRSILGGLFAAVLLLSFAPLQLWAFRIKPDMLGLFFTTAGLCLVAFWQRVEENRSTHARPTNAGLSRWRVPWLLSLAAVAFVMAHFTKQTLLAGPLAAGTLLLLRDWRLALRWGALSLGLLATTWLALDLVTHGQYTYHVWVLHKLPWYFDRFWKLTVQLRDTWPLILLGIAGIVACWRRPTVLNAYLMWAPASLIGAGVVGSHHNHLLETGVALALAGGQAAGLGLTRGGMLRVLAPVLLATQLLLWRAPLPWFVGDFGPDPEYGRFLGFIRDTPGEIMADDVSLLYAAGRPLRYDDPAAMGPASVLGLWDDSQFIDDIRNGRFSAILIEIDVFEPDPLDPSGRWTPRMLEAIRENYEIKFRDSVLIYVPKASAVTP
jgi:hypothetical protein